MKELFVVKGVSFESKKEAKEYRDKNGGHVSKGRDHRLYGVKGVPSKHPKRNRGSK